MLEINEDGKRYAVCNCCYERSFESDSDKELRKGLKYEGWYHHWDPIEQVWESYCPECREG